MYSKNKGHAGCITLVQHSLQTCFLENKGRLNLFSALHGSRFATITPDHMLIRRCRFDKIHCTYVCYHWSRFYQSPSQTGTPSLTTVFHRFSKISHRESHIQLKHHFSSQNSSLNNAEVSQRTLKIYHQYCLDEISDFEDSQVQDSF